MKHRPLHFKPSVRHDSDNGGNTVINIFPMSKEKRKELKTVVPNLDAVKGGYSDPVLRRRFQIRAKVIQSKMNDAQQTQEKGPDRPHVLVEFGTRRKLKGACFSRREAYFRNDAIRDLGMEWTLGEM